MKMSRLMKNNMRVRKNTRWALTRPIGLRKRTETLIEMKYVRARTPSLGPYSTITIWLLQAMAAN